MAELTKQAPSMGWRALQTPVSLWLTRLEVSLEKQRDSLPLWVPIGFALGIAAWFALPLKAGWIAVIMAGLCLALVGFALGREKRAGGALIWFGVMMALGCANIWYRAETRDAAPLEKPGIFGFSGTVIGISNNAETGKLRLVVKPDSGAGLPQKVRISMDPAAIANPATGMRLQLTARLMPPAAAALPGGYDFSRAAWFQEIGATGTLVGKVAILSQEGSTIGWRRAISDHIGRQSSFESAGIAMAFATGDQGQIISEDKDAMRASGLAHLLSVSGLHISAMIGAAMLLCMRILALSPTLALRWPLPLIAAAFGALAGIGYTLLSGAEVPAVRACVAAILVLAGIALGREALTLRLVAVGAMIILILWPEALIGPSFQLSFAAITSLIALHESQFARKYFARLEEGICKRILRGVVSLLATGLVVEIALAPIALYHFHQSGIYGALANIIAIPLSTFIIMPLIALALLFDLAGIGAPFWWMADQAIGWLLGLAHYVAQIPSSVALLPYVPNLAFAAMLLGALWLLLWSGRLRFWGALPFAMGAALTLSQSPPDLLVTADGRHAAVRGEDGRYGLLRDRAGDYVQDTLAEHSGVEALDVIESLPDAQCSADTCVVDIVRSGHNWRILATRSRHTLPWRDLVSACATSDIVFSDRKLPEACMPKWLKADRDFLALHGGFAVQLGPPAIRTTLLQRDDHPWRRYDARGNKQIYLNASKHTKLVLN